MARRIFLEPLWKPHVGYHLRELMRYPPQGYEFVCRGEAGGFVAARVSQKMFAPAALGLVGSIAPVSLLKAVLNAARVQVPSDCDLVYCCHHFSLRKRPWVAEIDAVWDPVGPGRGIFRRFWPYAERLMNSVWCKSVLVFSEFSKQVVQSVLNTSEARRKVVVLPRAVHQKREARTEPHEGFNLLFVGSGNLAGEFEMRGGKEVLEAFRRLCPKHRDVTLTIRSDIPPSVARAYSDVLEHRSIRWIRRWLSLEEMNQLYASADALVLPGHYDNWLVVLEAMSFGLPVIVTDIYANPERVRHGENGLLVRPARHVPYYQNGLPLFTFSRAFQLAIQRVDPEMVDDLVEQITTLVENRPYAERLGEAGRRMVEEGPFSIENRNRVLKEVFDAAIDSGG